MLYKGKIADLFVQVRIHTTSTQTLPRNNPNPLYQALIKAVKAFEDVGKELVALQVQKISAQKKDLEVNGYRGRGRPKMTQKELVKESVVAGEEELVARVQAEPFKTEEGQHMESLSQWRSRRSPARRRR